VSIDATGMTMMSNGAGTIVLLVRDGIVSCSQVICTLLNNGTPITSNNIGSQNVNYATSSTESVNTYRLTNGTKYAYVSANDNLLGSNPSIMYVGSSGNPWAGGYGVSGWITTSDARKKNTIEALDDRYSVLFDCLIAKRFRLNDGSSNRFHVGIISQELEEALVASGLTSNDFAGFIKDPIYSRTLKNGAYDTSSEIVDYNYCARYEEFIMLLVDQVQKLKKRVSNLGA
jgi:hypothetical protein